VLDLDAEVVHPGHFTRLVFKQDELERWFGDGELA
jgi:hypothetical protein